MQRLMRTTLPPPPPLRLVRVFVGFGFNYPTNVPILWSDKNNVSCLPWAARHLAIFLWPEPSIEVLAEEQLEETWFNPS